MKQENVYVYIGRFQIAHTGHEEVIKYAATKADRIILVVGSSDLARDPKNPFTFEERKSVLEEMSQRIVCEQWQQGRTVKVDIVPVHDSIYNNTKWLKEVQDQVQACTKSANITLTGCRKDGDNSTFYLEFFPQWKHDFTKEFEGTIDDTNKSGVISSTKLRHQYFIENKIPSAIPHETAEFLEDFKVCYPEIFDNLVNEYKFIERYRKQMMDTLPYNNIPFLTGDSLVVCAGHALLVKRRTYPGKGLWALPGGFFDAWQDQNQEETALRELKEETKIQVPYNKLKGSVVKVDEFGDFERSLRWRIITKCVHIKLDGNTLPKVKGSDDAEQAMWIPLTEIAQNRDKFFEDHYQIIATMLGL